MGKGRKLHNFNDSTKKTSMTLTSDLNLISWSFYSLFTSELLHIKLKAFDQSEAKSK